MRLAIGTVQFGLDYGISNANGRTPQEEVGRILDVAYDSGIDTLDTAAAYGDAEQVLGQIGVAGWKVVSKIPSLPNENLNGRAWVLNHIHRSLNRLRIDRLDGLLLHRATDLLTAQGRNLVAGMREAKEKELVDKVGYSIYSPQSLSELTEVMRPDLVQAPLNVLDQRLANSGWLARLAETGAEVHVRSVFMQGLLLMRRECRPQAFDRWRDLWRHWEAVAGSPEHALALCLGYVKAQPSISRIIVGVECLAHLKQLLEIWKEAAPFDAAGLASDDPQLVDPSNWRFN